MKRLILIFIVFLFTFSVFSQDFDPRIYLENAKFVDSINNKTYSILKGGNLFNSYNGIDYAQLCLVSKYNISVDIEADYHSYNQIRYSISNDGVLIALLKEVLVDGILIPTRIDIYHLPSRSKPINKKVKTFDLFKLGVDSINSFEFDKNNRLIIKSDIGIIDYNAETCNH